MKKTITLILLILFTLKSKAQCYTTVAAGLRHVLAIKSNGTLWGWGDNGYGQLGDGTTVSRSLPVQIGTATNWAKLEAGDINSFGIKTDGTLWAWGSNSFYQLGNNTTLSSNVPIQIGTATNWDMVSAGGIHT